MKNRINAHIVNILTLLALGLANASGVLADDCFLIEGNVNAPAAAAKPCGVDAPVIIPDANSRLRAEPLGAASATGVPAISAKEFRFQPKTEGAATAQKDKWLVAPDKSSIRATEQRPGMVELQLPATPTATVEGGN